MSVQPKTGAGKDSRTGKNCWLPVLNYVHSGLVFLDLPLLCLFHQVVQVVVKVLHVCRQFLEIPCNMFNICMNVPEFSLDMTE